MLEVGRRNANTALFNGKTRAVESAVGLSNITRTIIVLRSPPNQIPYATRPDSVRRPTGQRTEHTTKEAIVKGINAALEFSNRKKYRLLAYAVQ